MLARDLRNILLILLALITQPLVAEERLEDVGSDGDEVEVALLLKIAYVDLKLRERKIAELPLTAGNYESEHKGIITDRIEIYPGNPMLHSRRPEDRLVLLYRGTNKDRILLGKIQVRYYAVRKNIWLPRFRINEEIIPIRKGDRWIATSSIPGVSEPLLLTGSAVPNAEGYYPRLKISFSSKRFFLDSWTIK